MSPIHENKTRILRPVERVGCLKCESPKAGPAARIHHRVHKFTGFLTRDGPPIADSFRAAVEKNNRDDQKVFHTTERRLSLYGFNDPDVGSFHVESQRERLGCEVCHDSFELDGGADRRIGIAGRLGSRSLHPQCL